MTTREKEAKVVLSGSDAAVFRCPSSESCLWHNVFETSRIGFAVYDHQGRLVEINRAGLDLFGIVDINSFCAIDLFSHLVFPNQFKKRLEVGGAVEFNTPYDFDIVKTAGKFKTNRSGIIYLHVMINTLSGDTDSAKPMYLVQVQEITERKQVEDELRRSQKGLERRVAQRTDELQRINDALTFEIDQRRHRERQLYETNEFLESMFSTINFLIAYMDKDFDFIRVNKAYAAADGRPPDFYIGRNHFDLFADAENERIFRKVVQTGEPFFAFEKPFSYPNNPERGTSYWDWTLHPVKDMAGNIGGLILVLVDVTARKHAQEAMNESEKRFRIMTEAMDDVFWMATPDRGQVLYISPAYEKLWGRAVESLYASPEDFINAVHPDDRGRVETVVRDYVGKIWDYEYRIIRPDGTMRWIRDKGYPVKDETGCLQMLTGVAIDITELKATEASLVKSRAQIRRLSSELLAAHEKERKQLAQELHDSLGSGLAAVKMCLENILARPDFGDSDREPVLGHAVEVVQNAIGECRRIQKGLRPPMLDELGILSTIDWHCQQLQNLCSGIHVETQVTLCESDIADPLKIVIYRIVQEATNNVTKHSGADRIRIALEKTGDAITLSIEDNGCGFDLDQAMTRNGYGVLGMKERVELSGGRFRIKSASGAGTALQASWNAHGTGRPEAAEIVSFLKN